MYKTLNMSSILYIRYALQIFREILKVSLIWWVKENRGLLISAGKAEILKSVRLEKYKTSNLWQQFKLECTIFSSRVFMGLVCFISLGFFPLMSVPTAA